MTNPAMYMALLHLRVDLETCAESLAARSTRPILAEIAEQRETAAGIDRLSGDVARFVGGEEGEHAGDLFRRADATERNVRFDGSAPGRIAGPGGVDGGIDRAGPDGVDANAAAGELECQGARQAGHATLADGISEIAGLGDDLVDAGAVDDVAAAPAADKMRQRLLRAEHSAGQIHLEDAAVGFDIERFARRLLLEAGIVDQTIQARPARKHGFKHRCNRGLTADIGVNDEMVLLAMAVLGRGAAHARQRVLGRFARADVIDRNRGALLREPDRDGAPDALRGAGDKGVLADQARGTPGRTIGLLHDWLPGLLA